MNECLLQSHSPGALHLLPSLPPALSARGSFRRLKARGDVSVSVWWEDGRALAAVLTFHSRHPWLRGQLEAPSGFFSQAGGDGDGLGAEVWVLSPNKMKLQTNRSTAETCASSAVVSAAQSFVVPLQLPTDSVVKLTVVAFPCTVVLCSVYQGDSTACKFATNTILQR